MDRGKLQVEVIKHFERNVGCNVFAEDIARELGTSKEAIQSCVSHLRSRRGFNVTVPARGVYLYNGGWVDPQENKPTPALFEAIGTTKKGTILLRDEDGVLYQALPLDM